MKIYQQLTSDRLLARIFSSNILINVPHIELRKVHKIQRKEAYG
jgi:hypothetical protein